MNPSHPFSPEYAIDNLALAGNKMKSYRVNPINFIFKFLSKLFY